MKNIVSLAVLSLLFLPSLVSASVDMNLKYGMKNTEVSELQDFLIDKGFLVSNSTGFFGLLTLKAVEAYQTSVQVPSTGYVGILTRTEINNELAMAIEASNQAEITEMGTSTPVVNAPAPVQPPVSVGSVPAPTESSPSAGVVLGNLLKVAMADYSGNQAKYIENPNSKYIVAFFDMGTASKIFIQRPNNSNYRANSGNEFTGAFNGQVTIGLEPEDLGTEWMVTSYDAQGNVLGTTTGTFELNQ